MAVLCGSSQTTSCDKTRDGNAMDKHPGCTRLPDTRAGMRTLVLHGSWKRSESGRLAQSWHWRPETVSLGHAVSSSASRNPLICTRPQETLLEYLDDCEPRKSRGTQGGNKIALYSTNHKASNGAGRTLLAMRNPGTVLAVQQPRFFRRRRGATKRGR